MNGGNVAVSKSYNPGKFNSPLAEVSNRKYFSAKLK
jgi:hypothetical protein